MDDATPDLAALRGLHNLRDVGGLPTRDGSTVRPGHVLRAGTPAFLDDTGAAHVVDGLGVRTRVDLRSAAEVEGETSGALRRLETRAGAVRHLELHAGPQEWDLSASHRSDWVADYYLRYLEHSAGALRDLVHLLAEPAAYPVLLHCTAGKDRTGVAVALVLDVLGVPDEEIAGDYARSAEAVDDLAVVLRHLPRYAQRVEQVPQESLTSRPESMRSFLTGMRARHGSAATYLRTAGVSDAGLDAVRERLLH